MVCITHIADLTPSAFAGRRPPVDDVERLSPGGGLGCPEEGLEAERVPVLPSIVCLEEVDRETRTSLKQHRAQPQTTDRADPVI